MAKDDVENPEELQETPQEDASQEGTPQEDVAQEESDAPAQEEAPQETPATEGLIFQPLAPHELGYLPEDEPQETQESPEALEEDAADQESVALQEEVTPELSDTSEISLPDDAPEGDPADTPQEGPGDELSASEASDDAIPQELPEEAHDASGDLESTTVIPGYALTQYEPAEDVSEDIDGEEVAYVEEREGPQEDLPSIDFDKATEENTTLEKRDLVKQAHRRSKFYKGLLAVLLLAVLVAVGVFIYKLFGAIDEVGEGPVAPTNTQQGDSVPGARDVNPIASQVPDAPTPLAGEATVGATKGGLKATTGETILFKGARVIPSVTECRVLETTDFCLAGVVRAGDVVADVYYLKDAAHSRLFENPEGFTNTAVTGAAAYGSMSLSLGEKNAPALVAVNDSAAGWLLLGEQGDPKTLAPSITVASK